MKCSVKVGLTKKGRAIECGQIAHRYVGNKGFCSAHEQEAFKACCLGGRLPHRNSAEDPSLPRADAEEAP